MIFVNFMSFSHIICRFSPECHFSRIFWIIWCFLSNFLCCFTCFDVFSWFLVFFYVFFCNKTKRQIPRISALVSFFFINFFKSVCGDSKRRCPGLFPGLRCWEPNIKPTWKSWSKKGNGTLRGLKPSHTFPSFFFFYIRDGENSFTKFLWKIFYLLDGCI